MSKTYTAGLLRRPASARSEKLKPSAGVSAYSSYSSSQPGAVAPGSGESIFWKYFGLDENGDLYVKKNDSGEARNLWTYGDLIAGGIRSASESGPSGGASVSWEQLQESGTQIATITIDGRAIPVYAPVGGSGGGGTVTSVGLQAGAGLAASGGPITGDGTLSIGIATGYKLPTTSEWNGKQDAISDLSAIRSNASTAFGWGDHSQAGYLTGISQLMVTQALGFTPFNAGDVVQESGNSATKVMSQKAVSEAISGFLTEETDPIFSASVAKRITQSDITNWNSKTSNVGTITGIKMNGASKGTSGVVDLGTVLTEHQDLSAYQTKLSATNKLDPGYVGEDSTHRWWTDALADTLNGKANATALGNYLLKEDFRLDMLCKSTLGNDTDLNDIYNPSFADLTGHFRYYAYLGGSNGKAGVHGFPTTSNANALLTVDTYSDSGSLHLYQVGLSANGSIYFRNGAAEKVGGSWVSPWSDGNWKRLLWEDHNGDTGVTRDLMVGRNIIVAKGNKISLDTAGTAFWMRGAAADDYSLYVEAGYQADGITPAFTHFKTSAFCPNSTSQNANIGAEWCRWNNLYANRWCPDPNNTEHYIEYDAQNGCFHIHGPLVADGQIAAGGIISNS